MVKRTNRRPRRSFKRAVGSSSTRSGRTQKVRFSTEGQKLSCPFDPPVVTYRPWNSITLVIEIAINGASYYTGKNLNEWLGMFTGITPQTGVWFDVRLQTIRVWQTTNATTEIGFIAFDYLNGSSSEEVLESELASFIDMPSKNHLAALAYKWPSSYRQGPVPNTDLPIFAIEAEQEGTSRNILLHIPILWRTTQNRGSRSIHVMNSHQVPRCSKSLCYDAVVGLPAADCESI